MLLESAVQNLFDTTEKLSGKQIGLALVEYILETNHNNWEGHKPGDKAAYARLLNDFTACLKADLGKDRSYIFTGSRYLSTDRE